MVFLGWPYFATTLFFGWPVFLVLTNDDPNWPHFVNLLHRRSPCPNLWSSSRGNCRRLGRSFVETNPPLLTCKSWLNCAILPRAWLIMCRQIPGGELMMLFHQFPMIPETGNLLGICSILNAQNRKIQGLLVAISCYHGLDEEDVPNPADQSLVQAGGWRLLRRLHPTRSTSQVEKHPQPRGCMTRRRSICGVPKFNPKLFCSHRPAGTSVKTPSRKVGHWVACAKCLQPWFQGGNLLFWSLMRFALIYCHYIYFCIDIIWLTDSDSAIACLHIPNRFSFVKLIDGKRD